MVKVGRVVFVRHGESVWNITDKSRGLVTRFTGWANVALTSHGRLQAAAAGRCLKTFNLLPDAVYTSLLRRSQDTFQEMVKTVNIFHCPVINSWRLNERHYGALIGMSKDDAGKLLGHERVVSWRRSWDIAPPPMNTEDYLLWKDAPFAQPVTILTEPGKKSVIAREKDAAMPMTESLEDCAKRVKPIWVNGIAPRVARGETVLVVAHANSIRSMIKHIDDETMDDQNVRDVHIPAATPLVYSFRIDDDVLREHDKGRVSTAEMIRRLRPLGQPSPLGMTGRYVASKEIIRLALKSSVPMEDDLRRDGRPTFFDLIEKSVGDIVKYSQEQDQTRGEALVITDGRGNILHVNSEWERLCGFSNAEVQGKPSTFLQGPLTQQDALKKLNEKLRTGLPARASLINYRKNGAAFENVFTVIPVYDWLKKAEEQGNSPRRSLLTLDYGGSDPLHYVPYSKYMHPSHFIARLEKNYTRSYLPSLSEKEIQARNTKLNIVKEEKPRFEPPLIVDGDSG